MGGFSRSQPRSFTPLRSVQDDKRSAFVVAPSGAYSDMPLRAHYKPRPRAMGRKTKGGGLRLCAGFGGRVLRTGRKPADVVGVSVRGGMLFP